MLGRGLWEERAQHPRSSSCEVLSTGSVVSVVSVDGSLLCQALTAPGAGDVWSMHLGPAWHLVSMPVQDTCSLQQGQ